MKIKPPDMMGDIARFHKKFGLESPYPKEHMLPEDMAQFRIKFMREELEEYETADEMNDKPQLLDALVDLVYVALGTAYLHNFNFDEAWRRVHAANMRKVRAAKKEDSLRGSTFDVVKPKNWKAPDLTDLV